MPLPTRVPTESSTPTEGVARHIARVASRLFAAQGFDATPVRAIVETAGVTKPTLYYHFGSKSGLAQALLTRPLEELISTQREALEGGLDPVSVLTEMVEAHFRFCREDPDRSRFLYALFFGPLGTSLAAEVARLCDQLETLMGAAVGRLATAGLVRSDSIDALHSAVRGLIVVYTVNYLYRDENLDPGLACRLVDDLLRGFGLARCGGSET